MTRRLKPRDLVVELDRIGFEAEPRKASARTVAIGGARPLLAPLAVAGFAAMNVMLLSVSVWSGADGSHPCRCSTGFRR